MHTGLILGEDRAGDSRFSYGARKKKKERKKGRKKMEEGERERGRERGGKEGLSTLVELFPNPRRDLNGCQSFPVLGLVAREKLPCKGVKRARPTMREREILGHESLAS